MTSRHPRTITPSSAAVAGTPGSVCPSITSAASSLPPSLLRRGSLSSSPQRLTMGQQQHQHQQHQRWTRRRLRILLLRWVIVIVAITPLVLTTTRLWMKLRSSSTTSSTTMNNEPGIFSSSFFKAMEKKKEKDAKKHNITNVTRKKRKNIHSHYYHPKSNSNHHNNTNATLALLYPPGLLGGYRNQVLRLVALAQHALDRNWTLFLPSLRWSTQIPIRRRSKQQQQQQQQQQPTLSEVVDVLEWYPVPMDLLFDVEHWNRYATRQQLKQLKQLQQQQQKHKEKRVPPAVLPLLVSSHRSHGDPLSSQSSSSLHDCWQWLHDSPQEDDNTSESKREERDARHFLYRENMARGVLTPLAHLTQQLLLPTHWNAGNEEEEGIGKEKEVHTAFNPRNVDLLPNTSHCTHPYVYGGGTKSGRLWNEYLRLVVKQSQQQRNHHPPRRRRRRKQQTQAQQQDEEELAQPLGQEQLLPPLLGHVMQALQPLPHWRWVGQEFCIQQQQQHASSPSPSNIIQEYDDYYVTLHARVELEMLAHPCGRAMERNLSVILDHVGRFLNEQKMSIPLPVPVSRSPAQLAQPQPQPLHPTKYSTNTSSTLSWNHTTTTTIMTRHHHHHPYPTLMVAVSRQQMVDMRYKSSLVDMGLYNLHTLNTFVGFTDDFSNRTMKRRLHGRYPVVECGRAMMQRYYDFIDETTTASNHNDPYDHNNNHNNNNHSFIYKQELGTLLEQVINFDLAVQAYLFIGVEHSSYSNAVWTTRYYLRKRNSRNYKYTPLGIEPIIGLPPPHSNC